MLSNLFQASFLNYEAIVIQNPSLHSHRLDSRLEPPSVLPGYDYITCWDPATGVHLDTLPADSVEDIIGKIDLAKRAQLEWSQSTFSDRRRVLRSLLAWLVREQEICARVACRDTGKTSKGPIFRSWKYPPDLRPCLISGRRGSRRNTGDLQQT
jgi:Aldehyde dehydrogenase family